MWPPSFAAPGSGPLRSGAHAQRRATDHSGPVSLEWRIDVVTNCNVLTEGFDEPRVDCIVMARPTQSRLLYAQMVGRGTRRHPDKSDLLVIDVADNSRKHTLAGLHALFDLQPSFDLQGGNALAMADRLRAVAERYPWVDINKVKTPQDLEFITERIDLFRFAPPEEVQPYTRLSWCATPGGGSASASRIASTW